MKMVLRQVARKKSLYQRLPFFDFLRDQSRTVEERLAFFPCMASFILDFGDLNRHVLRDEASTDPYQQSLHPMSPDRPAAEVRPLYNRSAASADVARERRTRRELLNSERIAAKYGSYAVRVLKASIRTRVTSLTSVTKGCATCRTFAVVRLPPSLDTALASEHAIILAGGSIAAVFAMRGWEIRKSCHRYGERPATTRLAQLMAIPRGTPLAEHTYALHVAKDGRMIEYATIVETHHPDYLRRVDLVAIYGPDSAESRAARGVVYRRAA